jgi:hypothetical protein
VVSVGGGGVVEGLGIFAYDFTWVTNMAECDWNYIQCDAAGRVDRLDLAFVKVKGCKGS